MQLLVEDLLLVICLEGQVLLLDLETNEVTCSFPMIQICVNHQKCGFIHLCDSILMFAFHLSVLLKECSDNVFSEFQENKLNPDQPRDRNQMKHTSCSIVASAMFIALTNCNTAMYILNMFHHRVETDSNQ